MLLDLTSDELLATTRSVRKRLDLTRPVEREVLEECLRLGQQAPTASYAQNWHFVVVTDPQRRAALGELWRGADKVVYSTTLDEVSTPRTRLERTFDPDAVRSLVVASDRDVLVGGPGLAEHALRAGLVDEIGVVVAPVVVGGGTAYLPDGLRLDLRLLDERRFANGFAALRYAVVG